MKISYRLIYMYVAAIVIGFTIGKIITKIILLSTQ